MFKKLSKSEYKYRTKIISTYHLKKPKQKIIDCQKEYTYKELYENPSELMRILFDYSPLSTISAFNQMNYSVNKATEAFKKMVEAIKNYV